MTIKEFNLAEEIFHNLIYMKYKDHQPINIGVGIVKSLTENFIERCCVALLEIVFQQEKYDKTDYW